MKHIIIFTFMVSFAISLFAEVIIYDKNKKKEKNDIYNIENIVKRLTKKPDPEKQQYDDVKKSKYLADMYVPFVDFCNRDWYPDLRKYYIEN